MSLYLGNTRIEALGLGDSGAKKTVYAMLYTDGELAL
jgi:hypothetical protein